MAHNGRVSTEAAADLPEPSFSTAGLAREGYRTEAVDEFVDQLRRAVTHDPPTMAPYEVADQRFPVVRWAAGYDLREVDEYLDAARRVLRERHGQDAVASLEGREPEPKHFPTEWIYLVALVLIVAIVVFAVTQL